MSLSKADVLDGLVSYYGKSLDDKGKGLYLHLLKKYKVDQVKDAAAQCMANEATFPLFPILRKYLDEVQLSELEDTAIQQSNYCKVHFQTGADPHFSDPITYKIMNSTLRFQDWKKRSEEDVATYFQGQFVKEYKRIFLSNHERGKLKSKKEIEGEVKPPDNSHITEDMKQAAQWVKDVEKRSGERMDRYQFHSWAVYEGKNQGGDALRFDDVNFMEKIKASARFKKDFPRMWCVVNNIAKEKWPPLKIEEEGKKADSRRVSEVICNARQLLRSKKVSNLNREGSSGGYATHLTPLDV